jgi:hypothetical protein
MSKFLISYKMKTKFVIHSGIFLFCAAVVFFPGMAKGAGQFPIATNASVIQECGGIAFDGTNYLAAVLSGTNVAVQRFTSTGSLVGPLLVVGKGTSFPQVAFGGGNYLVYWDDNFVSGPSTYGQIVSPAGTKVGPPFLFGTAGISQTGAPRCLASDGTNFLAMWQDNNAYYGQFAASSGALSGSAFPVPGPTTSSSITLAYGGTNYLLAWQEGSPNNVFGALISRVGSVGGAFQISQTSSLDYNPLAAAFDGTNFLALWNQDSQNTPAGRPIWNLNGRLVSPTGALPGNEVAISTNGPLFPAVAFDGSNYLIAWGYDSDRTNSDATIRCRFFNRTVQSIGPEFTPFSNQGTNAPLIPLSGVVFDGSKFAVAATLGQLQFSPSGAIQGFASGMVYGTTIPRSTAAPQLASAGFAAGQYALTLSGTPGINYTIQFRTNLIGTNWTAIVTNSPTNGTFTLSDTHATNTSRFYRAVMQ